MQLSVNFICSANLLALLFEEVLWPAVFSTLNTPVGVDVLPLRHGPEQRALTVPSSQRNVEAALLASTLVSRKAV